MPPGRPQKPLFDLIGSSDPNASARSKAAARTSSAAAAPTTPPTKPTIRVELKPRLAVHSGESDAAPVSSPTPTTVRAPVTEVASGSAASGALGSLLGDQTVRVPRNLIFLGVAAILLLTLVTWLISARVAETKVTEKMAKDFGSPSLSPIREPAPPTMALDRGQSPEPVRPGPPGSAQQTGHPQSGPKNQTKSNQNQPSPLFASDPGRAIVTAKGFTTSDPREKGLNYCVLAVLSGPDARRAVDFLAENGIEAIGVPQVPAGVEASGRGGNNPILSLAYQVITLPGITRDEYSQKRTARTNMEANVTRLGQLWQKEQKGSSNFARFQWVKFD